LSSDVFISYSREDRQAAATVAGRLVRAGFSVWWDRDLLSGSDFEKVIEAELATAKAVVVLWSATSVRSGWVRDEAAAAAARGVLVPVSLDGTTPPLGFRSLHVVALTDGLSQLLRSIVRLTSQPARAQPKLLHPSGLGWVEAGCLFLLLTALVAFVYATWRP
jgi:hypothetical protein